MKVGTFSNFQTAQKIKETTKADAVTTNIGEDHIIRVTLIMKKPTRHVANSA